MMNIIVINLKITTKNSIIFSKNYDFLMSHLIEYLTGLLIVYIEKNQRKED